MTFRDKSDATSQARQLLEIVSTWAECEDGGAVYVRADDLAACYGEVAAERDRPLRHWTAIARELGGITKKRTKKTRGTRRVEYLVR